MPFNIGPGELILILLIALIVLGPGRLPEVATSLGKSIREFRKAATDVKDATSLEPPASPSSSAQASTAQASTSAPAPNRLEGPSEPNELHAPEPEATPAAAPSGEQHRGPAAS